MDEFGNATQRIAEILRSEYIGTVKPFNEEEMQRIENAVKDALRTYNIHIILGKAIHEKIQEDWDKRTSADLVLSLEGKDAQENAHCSWSSRARNAATGESTASWSSEPISGDVPEREEDYSVRRMGENSGARDRSDPAGRVLPGTRSVALII